MRTPAARRESLLDEFGRSGLTAVKFAALAGIKYQTFAAWVARRRKNAVAKAPVKPADPVRWLEAVVAQAQNPAALVLQLPSTLRELVATLQGALSTALAENKLLRQKLELFLKRYFGGTKNEGLDARQLELLLAGLEALQASAPAAAAKVPARSHPAARPVRQALPAQLETERVVLEPAEVQQQPEGWRRLGEEVTEEFGLEAGEVHQATVYPAQVCQCRTHGDRPATGPAD